MPQYTARCEICDEQETYVRSIAERHETPTCHGQSMTKLIDTPMVSAMAFQGHSGFVMPDGKNGGRGTWIESGDQYKRYLKANGKVPASEGYQEAEIVRKRRAQDNEKKLDSAVTTAVQKHLH